MKNNLIAMLSATVLVLAACAGPGAELLEQEPTRVPPTVEEQTLTEEPEPTVEPKVVEEPDEVEDLALVQVREYQGVDLSSIDDFRENSIAGTQDVSLDEYTLEITGLVKTSLELTYEEVLDRQQYEKVVTLYCVEGWDATILWEGVLVQDLLEEAGIRDNALVVIFHAADGYTSSLRLDFVRDSDIMLAYKMNGVTLPPERGFPFQVVAESKWGYKWVKWVTRIELSDDEDYRGYWESVGYSNNGSLNGPIFER